MISSPEICYQRKSLMHNSIDKHDMQLVAVHPSGAEEWVCPTCDRRFIIQWPPHYQKIVLNTGNEHAFHSCQTGDATPTTTTAVADVILSPELQKALEDFLEEIDIESW
jgi:hypothetical protein